MSGIFLGRWWHWAILVFVTVALYFAGAGRLHVVYFNDFILGLLAAVAIVVGLLIAGTRPGEQVTRDPPDPARRTSEQKSAGG